MNKTTSRPPLALALGLLLLTTACGGMYASHHEPAARHGGMWSGANGMTLYTFDRDTAHSGKSACNGPCATNWPPFLAGEMAQPQGEWSIVHREDGRRQWAFQGKPLYYWAKDQKPGDSTGDGVNNVWHVAR
ncbi:hypothetical protein AZSI13_13430 [Azospira sp. I13]|uniref:COG4315 family predicted lipoprotein n=1 Tax=Azospira sp. I13 TaxID=1765050 RepID=UPI000D4F6149|nr:hypothetical protein [Azospira sp. I13]GBG02016.1 hypothetical protein AZSI13_13430 [Azospira sp. I13]